jgi:Ca-activated chloride channel family protein
MKILFQLFLVLITLNINAQTKLSTTEFNLGNVRLLNQDVLDINIYNQSDEVIRLLRTDASKNISFSYTNKEFLIKRPEVIRIKLNPKKTGRISETIKLYFNNSSEPTEIIIHAKIKHIAKNSSQDCPRFGASGKMTMNKNGVYSPSGEIAAAYVTIDNKEETINPILAQKPEQIQEPKKDTIRKLIPKLPRNESRKPKEKEPETIDNRRDQPSLGKILFGKNDREKTEELVEKNDTAVIKEKVVIENTVISDTTSNLLSEEYKPNNVVFLIDASTSMRKEEKMDLLKSAMIELLNPLRPVDYLSIVTYSGESKIILSPTSAINKKEIISIIENIEADGSTQAVKGIKKAIQVAKSNFLNNGNNQILLASDGAFDIGERNLSLRKKIKFEANKGLKITVIGIKNERWTNKSLKEISELGNGELLKINSKSDTLKLLEEIKNQSSN